MGFKDRRPLRVLPYLAALLVLMFSLGSTGAALADQGQGKGADKAAASSSPTTPRSTTASRSTTSSQSTTTTKSSGKASGHVTSGTAGTSGDVTQPQPQSNADQNAGGANGACPSGPYCSTRDGSPSGNGNGTGKATGKPCAGCVGKADNKNPPGQYPNGSDRNAGYECDRNHGIGRTNPAHTGCASAPPPCTENCTPVPPCTTNCTPPPTTNRPPTVLGTEAFAHKPSTGPVSGVGQPEVLGTQALSPSAGTLPNTGASALMGLAGLTGLALVGFGAVTMARRRGAQH
ncbi:MAG: hypothetical protein ACXVW6_05920 [Nocardioidaceae bacterium]